jgi:hypothetical protein
MRRLLITGSRWWDNWIIPHYALAAEWMVTGGQAVLVSGNCPRRPDGTPGADYICEWLWESWGGTVERHPARWDLYGKPAGFRRNAEMAALPDVYKCLAFSLNNSGGTRNCMDEAKKRHIPVSLFELGVLA